MLTRCEQKEDQEQVYIEQLQTSLRQWDLVTDELFRLDVTITSNDDDYFVFEETLSETMALFSRDSWLVKNAAVRSQANEKFLDEQQRESAVFPPCGIVPFRGIVMYATPLCYQYINTTELYYVFRSLYAQVLYPSTSLFLSSFPLLPPSPTVALSLSVLAISFCISVLLPFAYRNLRHRRHHAAGQTI